MKLLICGSRYIQQNMLEGAMALAKYCLEKGDEIIVGDAPGVDHAVIVAAAEWCKANLKKGDKAPFTVFSPANRVLRWPDSVEMEIAERVVVREGTSYKNRDRLMVRNADLVIGVWNGTSPGTKATMDYAKQRGVPAYRMTENGQVKW